MAKDKKFFNLKNNNTTRDYIKDETTKPKTEEVRELSGADNDDTRSN